MSIAHTVRQYLDKKHANFRVVRHRHSSTSMESARNAQISSEELAKGVLLKDKYGYLLAVVPANRDLDLKEVEEEYGRRFHLAREEELSELFPDCEIGAVPAVGPAYNIDTVADSHLRTVTDLYFESGNHEDLIHVTEPEFENLLKGVEYKSISRPMEY